MLGRLALALQSHARRAARGVIRQGTSPRAANVRPGGAPAETGRARARARGRACVYSVDGVAGLILQAQAWDLGHPDDESVGRPEHRRCNRRTSAHRGGTGWMRGA
jgi:hypothetical protein